MSDNWHRLKHHHAGVCNFGQFLNQLNRNAVTFADSLSRRTITTQNNTQNAIKSTLSPTQVSLPNSSTFGQQPLTFRSCPNQDLPNPARPPKIPHVKLNVPRGRSQRTFVDGLRTGSAAQRSVQVLLMTIISYFFASYDLILVGRREDARFSFSISSILILSFDIQ